MDVEAGTRDGLGCRTTQKEAPGMQISDVMTRNVITAPPAMSLALAQRLMDDHRIRHSPRGAGGAARGPGE